MARLVPRIVKEIIGVGIYMPSADRTDDLLPFDIAILVKCHRGDIPTRGVIMASVPNPRCDLGEGIVCVMQTTNNNRVTLFTFRDSRVPRNLVTFQSLEVIL